VRLTRRKSLAILAYLAVTGQPVTRDRLVAMFWPETDTSHGHGSLRIALHEISRHAAVLSAERDAVRFLRDNCRVDVLDFQSLAGAAREQQERAAALYADDFMRGFGLRDSPEFDEWCFFESERLQSDLAHLLSGLVRDRERTAPLEVISHAQRLVRLDELNEAAHRALARAYLATGRRAAALRQIERCRELLATQVDAAPEPETLELYDRIAGESLASKPAAGEPHGTELVPPSAAAPRKRNAAWWKWAPLLPAMVLGVVALTTRLRPGATPRVPVVLVLPVRYISSTRQDSPIAEGLTDALYQRLVTTSGMRIRRATGPAPAWRVDGLRVDYAVDSTLLHEGSDLRLNARLLAPSGDALWASEPIPATSSDLIIAEEVLAGEIVQAILEAVGPRVQQYLLSAEVLLNPACETSYLLAEYHLNRDLSPTQRAQSYLTIEQQLDDLYVVDGYLRQVDQFWGAAVFGLLPPAPAAGLLHKALGRADGELEGYALDLARGVYALVYEGSPARAAVHLRAAHEVSPSAVPAGRWWALILAISGRFDPSLRLLDELRYYAPLDRLLPLYQSLVLYLAGRYDEAMTAADELDSPGHRWLVDLLKGKALLQSGQIEEAQASLERSVAAHASQEGRAYLAALQARRGHHRAARETLAVLMSGANDDPAGTRSPALAAVAQAALGRMDEARSSLVDALAAHDPALWFVKGDPLLEQVIAGMPELGQDIARLDRALAGG
jgi:DNA-binding SARP family transcriptional activator/TolB-like protein